MNLSRNIYRLLPLLLFALLLGSCSTGKPEVMTVEFCKSGVVIKNVAACEQFTITVDSEDIAIESWRYQGGKVIADFAWQPQQEYAFQLDGILLHQLSPNQPALVSLDSLPLQLTGSLEADDSVTVMDIAISEELELFVIATQNGRLQVYDLTSGKLLNNKVVTGVVLRTLALKDDLLVVGSQSPQGEILAYRLERNGELQEAWSYKTSQQLGRGQSDLNDPWAWIHQPGIYAMEFDESGNLLVLASHSGEKKKESQLYSFAAESGELNWQWPAAGPDLSMAAHFVRDAQSRRVLLSANLPDGSAKIVVINGDNGQQIFAQIIAAFEPFMQAANLWKGIALSPGGETAWAMTDDGRAFVADIKTGELKTAVLGQPIMAGDIPLLITGAGLEVINPQTALCFTGVTYFPWQLADGKQPQQAHPQANSIFELSNDGSFESLSKLPQLIQGLTRDKESGAIFASFAAHPIYSPGGSSGLLVLDGAKVRQFQIEGKTLYDDPVLGRDGKTIYLLEQATRHSQQEQLHGKNRLHVLRW